MEGDNGVWYVHVGRPRGNLVRISYGGTTATANVHVVRRLLGQFEGLAADAGCTLNVTYDRSVPAECRLGWGDSRGRGAPTDVAGAEP